MFFADVVRFYAQSQPERIAVREWGNGGNHSWLDLYKRQNRMARFFTKVGINMGDRVGFLCGNDILMLDAFFASYFTGAIIDPFNQRLIASELARMAQSEQPRLLFYESKWRDKALAMKQASPQNMNLVCIDSLSHDDEYAIADIEKESSDPLANDCPIKEHDTQMLVHTGGTTGFPKAAMLSYKCLFMNAVAETASWHLTQNERSYAAMPFYHTAGWNVLMLPVLFAGGEITLTKEFSADAFIALAEAGRMTAFMGADAMFRAVAAHPRFAKADFSKVRFMCCGASPVSQAVLDAFWSHGVKMLSGYGMSEYGPNGLCKEVNASFEESRRKPFSIGKPLAFTRARIANEDGSDAPLGEQGELWLRGELAFSGYWDNPSASTDAFDGEWVKTGDIAFMDADGDITVCDRKKNMYISGGENVFPLEVERAIEDCPEVLEACVIGVPDEKWGEVGKALIVAEPDNTPTIDGLRSWANAKLSTIKRPHYYALVDAIPKNAVGKRDLKAIKQLFGSANDSWR